MKEYRNSLFHSEVFSPRPFRVQGLALLFSIVAFLTILTGCSDGSSNDTELTQTELLRLQLDPRVGAMMVDSERAFQSGNYNYALALMDSVEQFVPDLADLHFMRGRVYTQLNQIELSQSAYQQVVDLDPLYEGVRYNMGLNAFRRGLLREAIDYYKAEESLNPTAILYLSMGRVYARLGEADSARTSYQQSIQLDPGNASTHMWLGQLEEEVGDLEAALASSQRGLGLRPDNLDYQYIIGTLHFRMADNERAIEYLQPVADSMPWHQGAQYNLGQTLMRIGEEERAGYYLERADAAQQTQQAVNEAEQEINQDPRNIEKWVALGDILYKSGQVEKAIESYLVAVSIDPTNLGLQTNLATLQVQAGQLQAGISRFQNILSFAPDLHEVRLNLGAVYANQGDYPAARLEWERVLEMAPNHPQAKAMLQQLDQIEARS